MDIIIWDTEYTSWKGAMERRWSGENEYRELIQLAARKVNLKTGVVLGEIDIFVKPIKNPILSDFIKNLTTITQEQIDEKGYSFTVAYQKLKSFIGDCPCLSFGEDSVILQENCDINKVVYDIRIPFIDAAIYFKNAGIDVRNYTSGTIAKAFNIELNGHVHYAMHDVDSLSQALVALQKTKPILLG